MPQSGSYELISQERLTSFSRVLKVAALTLAALFAAVAFYGARSGSVISGWLAATALVGLGESVVSFASIQGYSLGWYFSRLLWLVALSVLLIALIRSVSRVAAANVELAAVDSLTAAASRSAFLLTLQAETERCSRNGEQLALVWLNLDRFKDINDELGHEVGDEVLCRIVHRVQGLLAVHDSIGRLGGDEFGIVLCDRDAMDATLTAEALLEQIRQPIESGEVIINITAAAGMALFPGDAGNAQQLLHCADLAMDKAKRSGGDRCDAFDTQLAVESLSKTQIRRALGQALETGEFLLYYQPIFCLRDGRVAGAEALARWRHQGAIRAGEWIPVAEASGQIVAVSHQLLTCLARDLPLLLAQYGEDFFGHLQLVQQGTQRHPADQRRHRAVAT